MYNQFIDSAGLSQTFLQSFVIVGIVVLVVGVVFVMFWKYIVMGCAALLCIVVLANQKPQDPVPTTPQSSVPSVVVPATIPENKQEEQIEEKGMFMEDCLHLTNYTENECADIWYKREKVDSEIESKEQT